ncbi:MAG TPA: hypothetical protein VFI27_15815 [candidate division Zixibacteria bacterium]|nr:hypothetical protein [candidate division Zixibacteria bacterium]
MDFMAILEKFGFPVAMVVFFMVLFLRAQKSDKEEKSGMGKRITEIENYQRNRLEKMAVEATTVIIENTASNRKVAQSSERLASELSKRPCLKDHV